MPLFLKARTVALFCCNATLYQYWLVVFAEAEFEKKNTEEIENNEIMRKIRRKNEEYEKVLYMILRCSMVVI